MMYIVDWIWLCQWKRSHLPQILSIYSWLRENRKRLFGHLKQRPSNASIRRLEEWWSDEGLWGRGRPKKTWVRVIETNMSLYGLEENMALGRAKWREDISMQMTWLECILFTIWFLLINLLCICNFLSIKHILFFLFLKVFSNLCICFPYFSFFGGLSTSPLSRF